MNENIEKRKKKCPNFIRIQSSSKNKHELKTNINEEMIKNSNT